MGRVFFESIQGLFHAPESIAEVLLGAWEKMVRSSKSR
jgi:hypothetical protein